MPPSWSSSGVPLRFESSTYIATMEKSIADFHMNIRGQTGLLTYASFNNYSLRQLYHIPPDCFNSYEDHSNLIEYRLWDFELCSLGILNPSEIFVYMSLSNDPYNYIVTTSIRHMFSLSETTKVIK